MNNKNKIIAIIKMNSEKQAANCKIENRKYEKILSHENFSLVDRYYFGKNEYQMELKSVRNSWMIRNKKFLKWSSSFIFLYQLLPQCTACIYGHHLWLSRLLCLLKAFSPQIYQYWGPSSLASLILFNSCVFYSSNFAKSHFSQYTFF